MSQKIVIRDEKSSTFVEKSSLDPPKSVSGTLSGAPETGSGTPDPDPGVREGVSGRFWEGPKSVCYIIR